MTKTPYGKGFAICSNREKIFPLHLSLYNWGAIQKDWLVKDLDGNKYYRTPEYEEPISLGGDKYYFSVSKKDFLKARKLAFISNKSKFWPNNSNFKLVNRLARLKAKMEWDEIEEENFLEKFDSEPQTYSIGHNPNHLEYINAKINDYGISLVKERIIVDNLK